VAARRRNRALTASAASAVWLAALLVAGACLGTPAGSQKSENGTFRCERVILPGAAGWNRLRIDVTLLAGSASNWRLAKQAREDGSYLTLAQGGLGDLRIFDSMNREVPFLLFSSPESAGLWVDGTLTPLEADGRSRGFACDLGATRRVARLRVAGIPAPFYQRLRLDAAGGNLEWKTLLSESALFDLPGQGLRQLELEFGPVEIRTLRVLWSDAEGSSLPLPSSASVRIVTPLTPLQPLQVSVPFEPLAGEPGISRYRLRLPGPNLPITAVTITAAGTKQVLRARISENRRAGGAIANAVLGVASLWHRAEADQSASILTIPVEMPRQAEISLTLFNEANSPARIREASITLATLPWICFQSPGITPLTARCGSGDLAPAGNNTELSVAVDGPVAEALWEDSGAAIPSAALPDSLEGDGGMNPWRRPPGVWGVWALAGMLAVVSTVVIVWSVRRMRKP
jgi:hypothetical protein